MANEPKPLTIEDIKAAVTLVDEDGNTIKGIPSGTVTVKRLGGRLIPIQLILRELRKAHPDANFTFSVANVVKPKAENKAEKAPKKS